MHERDAIASLRSQPYEHAAGFIAADGEVLVCISVLKAALFCARYCGLAFSAQQSFGLRLSFCHPDDHGWVSPQRVLYVRTHSGIFRPGAPISKQPAHVPNVLQFVAVVPEFFLDSDTPAFASRGVVLRVGRCFLLCTGSFGAASPLAACAAARFAATAASYSTSESE